MITKYIQYYCLAIHFPDDTIQYISENGYTSSLSKALQFSSEHRARIKKFELQRNNIDADIGIIEVSVSFQDQNKLFYKLVQ